MNHNIRKLLDAVAILRDVQGCDLEVQSLAHKIKAMYGQGKDGLEGIAFIDACSDDELIAAIASGDTRTGLYPHICPFVFQYLRRNRSSCLATANNIRRC